MILNQVLHGYKDGHTLLASSIELEAEVKRQMLPMSDMSGGGMVNGFEQYITGYPLKQMNVFALAKTWYAPEMKRPGCVWTHTLLIDFSDLPTIDNLYLLVTLFKRPQSPDIKLGDYKIGLNIGLSSHTDNLIPAPESGQLKGLAKLILKFLYEEIEKSIFIRSSSPHQLERLILSIWGQQWPRLRRNFSFCTGSIAPRTIAGTFLNLQVVPTKSEVKPISSNEVVIEHFEQIKEVDVEEWIELAYSDLYYPVPHLRFFLNLYGSDLPLQRSSFKFLTESFVFFNKNKPGLDECIKFLAETFPLMQVADNLKLVILSDQNNPFANFLPKYQEATIVYQLTITKYYQSFDYKKLNYCSRFKNVFKGLDLRSMKILKEIIKKGPNSYGEEAIIELANLFSENLYLQTLWSDKQLSSVFISINPKLTYSKQYWLANTDHHVEIINQLQKPEISDKVDWPLIAKLLIETDSNIDPSIFGKMGLKMESFILDWINIQEAIPPRINWLIFLEKNPVAILDWLNQQEIPNKHIIEIIVRLLNPNSSTVVNNGLEPWLNFLLKIKKAKMLDASINVHAFYLTLAFNIDNEKSQSIFELTFEIIYYALSMDNLDYHLWKELEIHTKTLSFWKNWDKCKKITIALVEKYIKNGWQINTIIKNINNDEIQDRINRQYKKRR